MHTKILEAMFVSPDMINAIAGLGVWGLLMAIVIVLLIFRAPLSQLVSSLVKLLENIVTKSENASDIALKAGQVEVAVKVASAEIATVATNQIIPQSDSETQIEAAISSDNSQNLVSQMFDAVRERNDNEIDLIYAKMQEAETDPEQKIAHEAFYWYSKFAIGDRSSLKKLGELAQRELYAIPFVWLGFCYETASDFRKAAEAYESGLEKQAKVDLRGTLVISASDAYTKIGLTDKAVAILTREVAAQTDRTTLSKVYKALASVYKETDKPRLHVLSLEKAIELAPNNTDLLFDAAHDLNESRFEALSLLHYSSLLSFRADHAGALNNIGVLYQQLSMPINAVASYQKAVEQSNTLASANVAYILMNAGFGNEARKILDEAKVAADVHPNVGSAISALSEKTTIEGQQREKTIDDGLKQQEFLRVCADAYFNPQSTYGFEGVWIFATGQEVTSIQTNGQLLMSWEVGEKKHQLTGLVSGNAATVSYEEMKYEGYSGPKTRV